MTAIHTHDGGSPPLLYPGGRPEQDGSTVAYAGYEQAQSQAFSGSRRVTRPRWLGWRQPATLAVALIRPDGYVWWASDQACGDEVISALTVIGIRFRHAGGQITPTGR